MANPSPAPEVLARLREVEFNAGIFSTYRQQEDVWRAALEAALTALAAATREAERLAAELATFKRFMRTCDRQAAEIELYGEIQLAPRSPEGEERT